MFTPAEPALERGWVGRIEGDRVIHLAAQTLESFFTGGGTAREHAIYPLDGVRLLAPVLRPPAVRVFEDETTFAFANPEAIVGPDAEIAAPGDTVTLLSRIAAVIGAGEELAGFTVFADWRRNDVGPPKDRDFALGLGPVVVTPDEIHDGLAMVVRVDGKERLHSRETFDWDAARAVAADGTALRPGDLLAGPAPGTVDAIESGSRVELQVDAIGTLRQTVS
jgi:hypothetical protein